MWMMVRICCLGVVEGEKLADKCWASGVRFDDSGLEGDGWQSRDLWSMITYNTRALSLRRTAADILEQLPAVVGLQLIGEH